MIEFKYDEEGILQAYKDCVLVGPVITMGDEVKKDGVENSKRSQG